MTIDFTSILQTVTAISAGVVAVFSAPPLLAWRQKLGIDTLQTVSTLASQVVQAIEQKQPGALGATKKAFAESVLLGILQARGIQVPDSFLDAAIEAAVLALQPAAASTTSTTYAWDTPAPQTVVLPSAQPVSTVTITSAAPTSSS